MATSIQIFDVLQLCDVVNDPPWILKSSPQEFEALVRRCIVEQHFIDKPWQEVSDALFARADETDMPEQERQEACDRIHAGRIAYLAQDSTREPIEIDVGIPGMTDPFAWAVDDGNHRLYAAVVRGDETILANLSGSVSYLRECFGAQAA